ncbi:MAG: hypothetical protein M3R03_06125 [Pseudomonadota bacterium]|nr:hypothetical protein [Pseudomonadota bacterium]
MKRAISEQQCQARRTADPDDIVVCGRRGVNERYRMPGRDAPFDPSRDIMSVAREHDSWGEGGETGIGSCGPVGPGGHTGCIARSQARQRAQYQWGKNVPKKW